MKCPKILKVIANDDYNLIITYENGETKRFDVKPYIIGEWFGQLKDISIFKSVMPCGNTVEWCGGQDIAPHELYDLSVPITN